jgi:hypothetical protein
MTTDSASLSQIVLSALGPIRDSFCLLVALFLVVASQVLKLKNSTIVTRGGVSKLPTEFKVGLAIIPSIVTRDAATAIVAASDSPSSNLNHHSANHIRDHARGNCPTGCTTASSTSRHCRSSNARETQDGGASKGYLLFYRHHRRSNRCTEDIPFLASPVEVTTYNSASAKT